MKKMLLFLFCIFLLKPSLIIAQETDINKHKQDFQSTYRYYQSLVDKYNFSKNNYLTYQTVSSQAEYQQALKKLLLSEVDPLYSYANIVKIKLAEATNILWYKENLLYVKLDDEITYLYNSKAEIEKLSSIADSISFWKSLNSHYLSISEIGYNVLAIRKIGYITKTVENLKATREKALLFVSQIEVDTPEKKAAEERLLNLKNKIDAIDLNLTLIDQTQKAINNQNFYKSTENINSYLNVIILNSNEILNDISNVMFTLK
jgi:hypothetical protein